MDRAKLAKKFQWQVVDAKGLWLVRNFYDGLVNGGFFETYDEAFEHCNLLNIDLAIKGLDEWEPTHRNKRTGAICQLVREDIANERVTEFDEMAVLYTGADGTKYVTSYDDFFDGSFEALPTPPKGGDEK